MNYINNIIGKTNYGSYLDTCLTSNEKGFISNIEIESNIYTNVSKIVIVNIDTMSNEFSDPNIKVLPQSYQTNKKYNEPLIRVKNQTNINTKI